MSKLKKQKPKRNKPLSVSDPDGLYSVSSVWSCWLGRFISEPLMYCNAVKWCVNFLLCGLWRITFLLLICIFIFINEGFVFKQTELKRQFFLFVVFFLLDWRNWVFVQCVHVLFLNGWHFLFLLAERTGFILSVNFSIVGWCLCLSEFILCLSSFSFSFRQFPSS